MGGEPMGVWFGETACGLGLVGKVQPETFEFIMEGFSPGGTKPLVQNAGAMDRQRGWDLCFSPPKSVSTLWSQGDAWIREQIEAAHRAAVLDALKYLEENAFSTRRGHAGMGREMVGACIALFEHGATRAGDPQIHTHCVVASISLRQDGTTGSIASRPLFACKSVADALYLASLGEQLISRLGVELVDKKGRPFEIARVPPSLMAEFSKRRARILQHMAEHRTSGPEAAKIAALATRPAKLRAPREQLFREWQEAGARHNWSTDHARKLLNQCKAPTGPIPAKDIQASIKQLEEYNAHFGIRDITRAIAQHVQAKGYGAAKVETAAQKATLQLVSIGKYHGEPQYATRRMLGSEKWLFNRFIAGRTETRHQIAKEVVDKTLRKHTLSQEQQAALRHVTQGPGNVKLVDGLAGTGKSTLFRAAREAWEKAGYKVIGIALTGKASAELQRNTGIPSFTLALTLLQTNQPIFSVAGATLGSTSSSIFPHAPQWNRFAHLKIPRLTFGAGAVGGVTVDEKTIVVLDEASMVGTRQLNDLVFRLTAARAKLVLSGDSKQLGAIEAGAPFKSLGERFGAATLTDIQRQKHPWAREVIKDLAQGDVRKAVRELQSRGWIHVEANESAAITRLIYDWRQAGSPNQNLILSGTHERVDALNQAAHEHLLNEGVLRAEYMTHRGQMFHEGERIVFNSNSKRLGVVNGTFATIVGIGVTSLCVVDDEGRRFKFSPLRYGDFGLGYAITTHRAQGLTCENVFAYASNETSGREMAYVQASRARDQMHFYMEKGFAGKNLEGFIDSLGFGRQKCMASDILDGHYSDLDQEESVGREQSERLKRRFQTTQDKEDKTHRRSDRQQNETASENENQFRKPQEEASERKSKRDAESQKEAEREHRERMERDRQRRENDRSR